MLARACRYIVVGGKYSPKSSGDFPGHGNVDTVQFAAGVLPSAHSRSIPYIDGGSPGSLANAVYSTSPGADPALKRASVLLFFPALVPTANAAICAPLGRMYDAPDMSKCEDGIPLSAAESDVMDPDAGSMITSSHAPLTGGISAKMRSFPLPPLGRYAINPDGPWVSGVGLITTGSPIKAPVLQSNPNNLNVLPPCAGAIAAYSVLDCAS